jgi:hypothetical protein
METSRPTVRKAELSSGERMAQEANAVSRKARGIHNPTDRAYGLTERSPT